MSAPSLNRSMVFVRMGPPAGRGETSNRLKARPGYKRAAVAIAHKILVATYHMLSRQVSYHELGDLYLDKLNKHHLTRNLVHRLERFGYTVTLTLEQKAA
jgi:transposase